MQNSLTSSGNHMTQRTFALPGQGERKAPATRNRPGTSFPGTLRKFALPGILRNIDFPGILRNIALTGALKNMALTGAPKNIALTGALKNMALIGTLRNIALPGALKNIALPGALRNTSFPGILRNTALFLALVVLFSSCITPQYILDNDSAALQKQIHNKRVGNVFGDVFLTAGSTFLAVFTGVFVYSPSGNSLKKVALCNNGTDTLQVNMLTDQTWKDSSYADMMDIRIPPGKTARILLPAGAVYNLYFSNTPGTEEDDEFLVFDTNTMRKVNLYPGLTLPPDSTKIIPEKQNMPQ